MHQRLRLLDRVRQVARLKHYAASTEESYVRWIRRYILFHDKRHPQDMGEAEIEAFLTHLAVDQHVAASTQNQALCAILFLYQDVLHTEIKQEIHATRARTTGTARTQAPPDHHDLYPRTPARRPSRLQSPG